MRCQPQEEMKTYTKDFKLKVAKQAQAAINNKLSLNALSELTGVSDKSIRIWLDDIENLKDDLSQPILFEINENIKGLSARVEILQTIIQDGMRDIAKGMTEDDKPKKPVNPVSKKKAGRPPGKKKATTAISKTKILSDMVTKELDRMDNENGENDGNT